MGLAHGSRGEHRWELRESPEGATYVRVSHSHEPLAGETEML